jgi:excisionase family DNA binding protein
MTAQVVHFVELSESERREVTGLPMVQPGDSVQIRVVHQPSGAGETVTASLPSKAAELVTDILNRLARGERVAVLGDDQEITPNEAAHILGLSRPLVVRRMDIGELPFRYVGKHRRAKLRDVLALKERLEHQQAALDALAEQTEKLMTTYGL